MPFQFESQFSLRQMNGEKERKGEQVALAPVYNPLREDLLGGDSKQKIIERKIKEEKNKPR